MTEKQTGVDIAAAAERRWHRVSSNFDLGGGELGRLFPTVSAQVKRLCAEAFQAGYLARIEDELDEVTS